MIKTILVPVGAAVTDAPQFAAAVWVARLFSGHIDFLYARVEPVEAATDAAAFLGGAIVSPDMIERLESAATEREEKAFNAYRSFCEMEKLTVADAPAGPGSVSVAWHRETGTAADWVTSYGRTSDLLVVGRSVSSVPATTQILQTTLFDTGRPVLIPGSVPPDLDTVALAWKSTRETAHAVTAAMPFLTRAKRIVVLAAADSEPVNRESCERLVRSLRRQHSMVDASYLDLGFAGRRRSVIGCRSQDRRRPLRDGSLRPRSIAGVHLRWSHRTRGPRCRRVRADGSLAHRQAPGAAHS